MKKLKLALDNLEVESFDPGGDLPRGGTVHGLAVFRESIDSCDIDGERSWDAVITCLADCTSSWVHTYCADGCFLQPTNPATDPCH